MKYTSAGLSSTMAMTSGGRGVCGLHAQDFLVPDVPDSTPEVYRHGPGHGGEARLPHIGID